MQTVYYSLRTLFVIAQVVLFLALLGGLAALLANRTVRAIFKRNVLSYFSGVLGYLFIVVFVVAGAFLAFDSTFFTNNQATLDQLTDQFPILLLFLIPAITMSTWADERKLGTDELLFTLPATDMQILFGKYLAVLTVYTIALLFSLTHVAVLAFIGDPDPGLLLTTYFGYWLAGAALLGIGMFASVLTSSGTVAFVLGAVFCAVPVFIGTLAPFIDYRPQIFGFKFFSSDFLRALSLPEHLRDFALGVLPFNGLWYFVGLAVFALYLNYVFITRRHWVASQQTNMASHFMVRAACVAAVLVGLNVLTAIAVYRQDFTSEGLYSLSQTTKDLIARIQSERPITIQAYLSPDVPREYVAIRKRLIGLLRQYDQMGGSNIEVRYVDVRPFSPQADEAKLFGIKPVSVQSEREGRRYEENVYLGAVITSSFDEVVIPFFAAGSLAEYELTRSIRTVSDEKRPTLGVLKTDAEIIGASQSWRIVTELKQQYNVEEVSADSPIDMKKYDVLLAVLPSSLTAPQMKNLVTYVEAGRPTLIFDDPFPLAFSSMFGVSNAPRQPKPRPGGMFGMGGGPPPEAKADEGRATSLLNVLNIAWDNGEIVWDRYNPHPEFGEIPPEYLFIMPRKAIPNAFSPTSDITSGLQEMLAAYSGRIRPRQGGNVHFEPLVRTGPDSGLSEWEDYTEDGFDPTRMTPTTRLSPEPVRKRGFPLPLARATVKPDAPVGSELSFHCTAHGEKMKSTLVVVEGDGKPRTVAIDGTYQESPDWYVGGSPAVTIQVHPGDVIEWSNAQGEHGVCFNSQAEAENVLKFDAARSAMQLGSQKSGWGTDAVRANMDGHVIAAHITSKDKDKLNAVFVADVDLISNWFFQQREQVDVQRERGDTSLQLDNVTFVLSAVDVLAGDTRFLDLRKRRARNRTLKKVEDYTSSFVAERTRAEEDADRQAKAQLKAAQDRFNEQRKKLEEDTALDERTRQIMLRNLQAAEERRLDVAKENIDAAKKTKIEAVKAKTERNIRSAENRIRYYAVAIPPIPAILLGMFFFGWRMSNERREIKPDRLVRRKP